jgi:hypothetical protein
LQTTLLLLQEQRKHHLIKNGFGVSVKGMWGFTVQGEVSDIYNTSEEQT